MAGVDKAGGLDFIVQPPAAIVSSSPDGVRTVVVRIGPTAPLLKTVEYPVSSGGMELMSEITELDKRLRNVETDVATIKERLNHVPTKAELQTMLNGVQGKIIWTVVGFALLAVAKWALPLIAPGLSG